MSRRLSEPGRQTALVSGVRYRAQRVSVQVPDTSLKPLCFRAARRTNVFQSDDATPSVMSADLPAGVYLLDVREDDEWAAGHAPDAVHVRLRGRGRRGGAV